MGSAQSDHFNDRPKGQPALSPQIFLSRADSSCRRSSNLALTEDEVDCTMRKTEGTRIQTTHSLSVPLVQLLPTVVAVHRNRSAEVSSPRFESLSGCHSK